MSSPNVLPTTALGGGYVYVHLRDKKTKGQILSLLHSYLVNSRVGIQTYNYKSTEHKNPIFMFLIRNSNEVNQVEMRFLFVHKFVWG
jgi:hypothetical protein